MQQIAIIQPIFSLSLLAALAFGIIFARIVRWASRKKWLGQTGWAVTIGVSFTLFAMVPVFGVNNVAIMFCYFAATGVPMIIEYITRIQQEIRKDIEDAQKVASEYLNERQAGNR